jgi:hypothetical protein
VTDYLAPHRARAVLVTIDTQRHFTGPGGPDDHGMEELGNIGVSLLEVDECLR